jgi:drug/metabolite transporter (DMT)-like permease
MKKNKLLPYLALFCVCFFWGTTFMGIRIGVQYMPPFILAGYRQTIAGLILCGYFVIKGDKWPPFKQFLSISLCGLLMIGLGNGLVTWAEQYISSGLAALLCASTPFWIIGINFCQKKLETFNAKIIVGLVIGLIGQIIIFYDNLADLSNPKYFAGIICIVIANFSWAVGTVITKQVKVSINPLFSAGIQMLVAGIALSILGMFKTDITTLHIEAKGIWAMLYLAVFGSALAYGAYIYVLGKLPTTIVSLYSYINPMVAILLGCVFLHEKLNAQVIMAMILTLIGVFLVNRGFSKKTSVIPDSEIE